MFGPARWIAVLTGIIICAAMSAAAQAAPNGAQVVARRGCTACHGSAGQGQPEAGYPRLAGQPAAYLLAQLEAFATGARPNPIMESQAKALSRDEMKAAADYFASLNAPGQPGSGANPQTLSAGREIVVNGLWQKNIPSCQACHGPGARGFALFPLLASQGAKYIEVQLDAWQAGNRPPGPDGIMAHIAKQLSPTEIHDAAVYLASLPPTGPVPTQLQPDVAPAVPDALPGYFQPPLGTDLPKGQFGAAVRRGHLIFTQTPRYAGKYIGNSQSCSNCHTNAGRQANSAPMWAAWGMFPAYRGKNRKVNDIVMRLQGCFIYSENAQASPTGGPPPAESPVMIDLESYMYWLSHGVPSGKKMAGRGYGHIAAPPEPFSRERGKQVYATNCAMCHGPSGQGRKFSDGAYAFPPLWGRHAYNWGAGMHAVNKAAAFIDHNMPFGNAGKLDLQQTWDVAAWVNSHPRPQDPRFNGNLKETVTRFHRHRKMDYYGKTVDGRVLGAPGTLDAWEKAMKSTD